MEMQKLSDKELELYSKVISLEGTTEERLKLIDKLGILNEYREVHKQYSKLCEENLEALKRGLFLTWYSIMEPTWLTGIGELARDAEERIIKTLDARLNDGFSDNELDGMLSYYSKWDWVFDRFNNYLAFKNKLPNGERKEFLDLIKDKDMSNRGQMGIYWNSLFSEKPSNQKK